MELTISDRLQELLPPLSPEEFEQLEQNIYRDGRVREPICYWQDNGTSVVVDGMNRYAIATRLGLPYTTTELFFEDQEEVELWILENQVGRRNLHHPHEQRKLIGEYYNRLKRKDGGHGDQRSGRQDDVPKKTTAQLVAEKTGLSPRTVQRHGDFVAAVETLQEPLREVIDQGVPITQAEVQTLSQAQPDQQVAVAEQLRTGQTVQQALQQAGVKAKKPAGGKPKVDTAQLFDQAMRHFAGSNGLVQIVDRMSVINGGQGPQYFRANRALNDLIGALKELRKGGT